MNNLVNVAFEGKPIFTATDSDGNVWFSAKNVAEALGYSDVKKAVQNWVEEKDRVALCDLKNPTFNGGVDLTPSVGNSQLAGLAAANFARQVMISKRTVLRFLMRCSAPKAEPFQDWLVDEVLPAIENTGSYSVAGNAPRQELTMPTLREALAMWLAQIDEKEKLAEQMGLKDWYTQYQIRNANAWFGTRKVHITLNRISEELGYPVRTRSELSSSDSHMPTNMYHVDVWRAYAKSERYLLNLPRTAYDWQNGQEQYGQKLLMNPMEH